ncbi:uncharacterized protein ARMOST_17714 [Armillaria ostoyae]|uniref:Uncharacterized protein n=1 Tax=Armillaria ostoyae TaxID=47428 RepID=A0A284RZR7_ARMOS|nr:uncharacterized protein ARMOST_17714 [Armillaria ostoyae]
MSEVIEYIGAATSDMGGRRAGTVCRRLVVHGAWIIKRWRVDLGAKVSEGSVKLLDDPEDEFESKRSMQAPWTRSSPPTHGQSSTESYASLLPLR